MGIVVVVEPQDETRCAVDARVAEYFDVAAVEPADPVDPITLGIGLDNHLAGQPQLPVNERPIDPGRVRQAAGVDEIKDSIVSGCRTQLSTPHNPPDRRLVGDSGKDIGRTLLIGLVQPESRGGNHSGLTAIALIDASARLRVAALPVCPGVFRDRATFILTAASLAGCLFLHAPQPIHFDQPRDLVGNPRVRFDRRVFLAHLAQQGRGYAMTGTVELVVRVAL